MKLTGRRRFRKDLQWEDGPLVLVLQIEVTEFVITNENKPGRWVCFWRDAAPEDVTGEVII